MGIIIFQCTDRLERDRLILFVYKLINNKVGGTEIDSVYQIG